MIYMNKQLTKKHSFERMERKWTYQKSNISINNLIIALLRSPFLFKEKFETRQVNSIYFDDKNFSSIIQNIDGHQIKQKYRARWYGEKNTIEKLFFEIKEKDGFVSKKTVIPINFKGKIRFDLAGISKINDEINKILNFKISLFPILSTHYHRKYYLSDNNKIRATLDYDIGSHQLIYKYELNFVKNFNDLILEFKYDVENDNYVRSHLRDNSSRFSKSSKYVNSAISNPQFSS